MAKTKSKKTMKKRTTKSRVNVSRSNTKKYAIIFSLVFAVIGGFFVYKSFAGVAANLVTFENNDTSKCDQGVNTTSGNSSFTTTAAKAYEGSYSALASYTGGTSNAYARCVVSANWATGDDVWYGAALFLPVGFTQSMQQQVDLIRWDNFSLANTSQDWGGLIIENHDKLARLKRFNVYNDAADLSPTFKIPEGRWVWMEIHQKLSPNTGEAYNEIYMDNTLIGVSTTANTYGRNITKVRYGLVAIGAGSQTNPLSLNIDRATISSSKLGPVAAPGTTTTPTADKTPPSVPNASAVAASSSQINVSWTASSDNVGLSSYKVYRNNTLVANIAASALSWSNIGLATNTSYSYQVSSVDTSGNESQRSPAVSATTLAATPAPTPSTPPPTTTPTATSTITEGEKFNYNTKTASIVSDSKASGDKSLRFGTNGSASKTITTGTASKVVVRLRSWACSVKPVFNVAIDGKTISSTSIGSGNFYDLTIPSSIAAGNHNVVVSMSNAKYSSSSCGNSIHFDKITIQ